MQTLYSVVKRTRAFERYAHEILSRAESSLSRVITLEDSYKRLTGLSIKQDELFRQALRCTEHGLFRAAHVMAWAGFMDFVEEKLSARKMRKLKSVRPNWNYATMDELREYVSEYQIIDVCKDIGLCRKNEVKALHGLLNKRNECAHPSEFYPLLNETLGFISELMQRIQNLKPRRI
jgi:ribosomal protein S18